jgi:hypothetical protein
MRLSPPWWQLAFSRVLALKKSGAITMVDVLQ